MDKSRFLPESRCLDPKGLMVSRAGTWVPVFCANCGKAGGMVPETSTFAFYLCDACAETHGVIANTLMVPDEAFFAEMAAEREAMQQKEEG